MRTVALTLALACLAATAGCSQATSTPPDTDAIAVAIENEIRAGKDMSDVEVKCANAQPTHSPASIECVVRSDGAEEQVVARMIDGNTEWDWSSNTTLAASLLNMIKVKEDVRTALESQLGTTGLTVNCPRSVSKAAGVTFQCTVMDTDGTNKTIVIRQQDDQGTVVWTLEQ